MIKITKLEQLQEIKLKENKLFYIYGKVGSGKTYFAKEIMKKTNQNIFYTNFHNIVQNFVDGNTKEIKEDIIIIDDGITEIKEGYFIGLTIKRLLEDLLKKGKTIIIISNIEPSKLEKINSPLPKLILSGEKINISYNLEARMQIAQKYVEESKILVDLVDMEEIKKTVKEEKDIRKILGYINNMKISC